MQKIGVILANLGTPSEPKPKAIRSYLAEFLGDQRVIDYPKWFWYPILYGVILPIRSIKVAKAYKSIWTEQGSPLRNISYKQRDALQEVLGEGYKVEVGMTYGEPSMDCAWQSLKAAGCRKVIMLPLYPQYSATSTAAAYDALQRALAKERHLPDVRFISDYHAHPKYIAALKASVEAHWEKKGKGRHLLLSYHGIPKRYATNGDPYPQHCENTSRLLAQALGLNESEYTQTYQSRVGKEPWLEPYTDETLEGMPEKGIKNLDVICPAFSVDCLETLEEMAMENREVFEEAGGEDYEYIAALNDSAPHIEMMQSLIEEHGWK